MYEICTLLPIVKIMNYYLAFIERRDIEFYELVKADTKEQAYEKVKHRFPDAYGIEINEPIK